MRWKKIFMCVLAVGCFLQNIFAFEGRIEPNQYVLEKEVEVIEDNINIRSGPGVEYAVIGKTTKGERLDVLGVLGNWYIVYLPNGVVGVIHGEFTRVTKLGDTVVGEGATSDILVGNDDSEASRLLQLVNMERNRYHLEPYAWDEKLNKIAQMKAEDMANNQYIGHFSNQYGTPFQMLKELNVVYKTASENISTHSSVEKAYHKMMSKPAQRSNVLHTGFTKVGLGIANSEEHGKIVVQLFIQD